MKSLIDLLEFRVSDETRARKIVGEYMGVCRLTSVHDIMRAAYSIKISLGEAIELIKLVCKKVGSPNAPNIETSSRRCSYYRSNTICFNTNTPSIGITLHELAHFLEPTQIVTRTREYSPEEAKRYYDKYGYYPFDFEEKLGRATRTTYRRDVHGPKFVKKLDELLVLWKQIVCSKEMVFKKKEIFQSPFGYHEFEKDFSFKEQKATRKLPVEIYELLKKFNDKFYTITFNEDNLSLYIDYTSDQKHEFGVFIRALNILVKKLEIKTKLKKYNKISGEFEMSFEPGMIDEQAVHFLWQKQNCNYRVLCFIDTRKIYSTRLDKGIETDVFLSSDGKCRCERCSLSDSSSAFKQNHTIIEDREK